MNFKNEAESEISLLLRLAKERNTEQGVLVCTKVLEQLRQARSESEALKILGKVNHAYLGIEAHGQLTQTEYAAVMHLRELAANSSFKADGLQPRP